MFKTLRDPKHFPKLKETFWINDQDLPAIEINQELEIVHDDVSKSKWLNGQTEIKKITETEKESRIEYRFVIILHKPKRDQTEQSEPIIYIGLLRN